MSKVIAAMILLAGFFGLAGCGSFSAREFHVKKLTRE